MQMPQREHEHDDIDISHCYELMRSFCETDNGDHESPDCCTVQMSRDLASTIESSVALVEKCVDFSSNAISSSSWQSGDDLECLSELVRGAQNVYTRFRGIRTKVFQVLRIPEDARHDEALSKISNNAEQLIVHVECFVERWSRTKGRLERLQDRIHKFLSGELASDLWIHDIDKRLEEIKDESDRYIQRVKPYHEFNYHLLLPSLPPSEPNLRRSVDVNSIQHLHQKAESGSSSPREHAKQSPKKTRKCPLLCCF